MKRGRGFRWTSSRREETHFWVIEVLTRSKLVPALGEKRHSIPPLDASLSVVSRAQRFTGHNLEQLLGSEFMVIVGKWNHTNVEFHGPQQQQKTLESGWFPLYINTSTALDLAVYKIQLKRLCDQHLPNQTGSLATSHRLWKWHANRMYITLCFCSICAFLNQGI